MKLAEPTTTLTDYLLGAETLVFAVLLFRMALSEGQLSVGLWAAGFLATAIAAITGGTFHGFPDVDPAGRSALWKCTVYAVGIAGACLFASATLASFKGTIRHVLIGLCIVDFLIYAGWMVNHNEFKYVIYDYALAMIGTLFIQFVAIRNSDGSAPWIIAGLLVSFAAAGIQQSGIQIRKNFNFNDLYHIIQMGAMVLLYRGATLLRDK